MQKERPILFSTPMVQAILEGRKTMTRRACKDNGDNLIGYEYVTNNPTYPEMWNGKKSERYTGWVAMFNNLPVVMPRKCPYGNIGDILWVREMLYQNGELGLEYVADKEYIDENIIPEDHKPYRNYAHCNIPSIHMPKYLCRIFLEIIDIKVERVKNISEKDAILEGSIPSGGNILGLRDGAIGLFKSLWQSINGEESWNQNPWVWAITFKQIKK